MLHKLDLVSSSRLLRRHVPLSLSLSLAHFPGLVLSLSVMCLLREWAERKYLLTGDRMETTSRQVWGHNPGGRGRGGEAQQ